MTLVDYPLFSGVVVIHSLHVSSFREAHHQELIFPVQSASGIVCTVTCNVLLWLFLKHDNNLKKIPFHFDVDSVLQNRAMQAHMTLQQSTLSTPNPPPSPSTV